MRVISGANNEYRDFYFKLKEDCAKFGYSFSGYDYGGLGEGVSIDAGLRNPTDYTRYIGKIPGKPKIILDAIERHNDFIVYLDADVRILDDFREVVGDYDIGVTVHDPIYHDGALGNDAYPHITCYLNAGVIFANNTDGAKRFIAEWMKDVETSPTGSDQEALTNFLRRHILDWSQENHDVMGIKVRFFPSLVYNYTENRGYKDNPKMKHFTGTIIDKIARGALL